MQKKFLFLVALGLVAIGGLPAAAAVPVEVRSLSTSSPTSPSTMPGMNPGSPDMPGMGNGDGTTGKSSPDRPLEPVLGVFGVGTSAVLFGAGFLRRRDRVLNLAKETNVGCT